MTLQHLLAGLAVALAIEGLVYALFPGFMRRVLATLALAPEDRLRAGGLVAAALGVAAAWLLTAR
ncbi:MAG: DUF2065 family protein [Acetobacteraceae bacterium]|nr:DUF2065 family protein [Acetobacteraceae bacterium]